MVTSIAGYEIQGVCGSQCDPDEWNTLILWNENTRDWQESVRGDGTGTTMTRDEAEFRIKLLLDESDPMVKRIRIVPIEEESEDQ